MLKTSTDYNRACMEELQRVAGKTFARAAIRSKRMGAAVDQHPAKLCYEDRMGDGCTFRFCFPQKIDFDPNTHTRHDPIQPADWRQRSGQCRGCGDRCII